MKKILLVVLALVLVLSLTACGDNNRVEPENGENDSTNPPVIESENEIKPDADNITNYDLTTVDGWLSSWGLTEEDFKPANFTRLDKTSYSLETYEIKEVGAYIDNALTDEEAKAWVEEIILKLNTLSEDGKLINVLKDGEELTADYIMGRTTHSGSGQFMYKGKKATALICVMPRSLDNADPNEAMPACTLHLEY